MIVVDTSAWIEWLENRPTAKLPGPFIPQMDNWIVPTIVLFELVKVLKRQVGETAFAQKCIVEQLQLETALFAADLCININWQRLMRSLMQPRLSMALTY